MNNQFKKFFSAAVIIVFMFSCFNVFMSSAKAQALKTGDLIKAPEFSAVYYYGADGKRYVFPNQKTYDTWYNDFSKVIVITLEELGNIPIGGNITYREGTRLIKITTDPKVYAVSPDGTLRALDSEVRAKTLYGDNWAQLIDDVPDAFFTNYNVVAPINSNQHPDSTIIERPDGKRYLIKNGQKKFFADDVFVKNRYNAEYLIHTNMDYPDGQPINDYEYNLAEPGPSLYTSSGEEEQEPTKKEVTQISVVADHSQIAANGQAKAIISVTLKDSSGQVITDSEATVNFMKNDLGTFSATSVQPVAGIAQTVLTAGYKPGTAEVVVSIGNISQDINIDIVSADLLQPGQTIMYDPSLISPLYKNSAGADEEYTLTWNKIESLSIDYYIVEEATNDTFSQGLTQYTTATNSITLKHSYPQTIKYWYRVKGVHNTVEGLWNNTLDGNAVNHEVTGTNI